MSVCSPLPCMLVCIFFMRKQHTRPRVQRAPGIPCALYFGRGTTNLESSGETMPRERECMPEPEPIAEPHSATSRPRLVAWLSCTAVIPLTGNRTMIRKR